jgi:hypothetical protein
MVTKIVEFPFKNALNHKINEITVDMLEAIVATQSNQSFFHEIVNRASHLFQHRQLVEDSLWFDFIKVYVGLPINETMLMRIDETDELPKSVIAIPLGLIIQLEEICGVSIPISIPLDVAATSDEETARGLMYNWVHTDTNSLTRSLLEVWHNLISRHFYPQISEALSEKIISNPKKHVATLCETAAIDLTVKNTEKQKRMLLLTALHMTNTFAENLADVTEICLEDGDDRSVDEISDLYKTTDLVSLYNWIGDEIGFGPIFGGFEGFVDYCRSLLNDHEFRLKEEEKYAWLQVIMVNTDLEDFYNGQ